MSGKKPWICAILLCFLIILAVGVGSLVYRKIVPVDRIASPDGGICLSVYRQNADSYTWKYSAGPDWTGSGWSIGGVTEYLGGSFSPDGRHSVLVFLGEDGREQYYWTDYETPLSGGLSIEPACKSEEAFAEAFRQENGMWLHMQLRFLGWHGSKNWMLFGYTLTAIDGTKHAGHFWFDVEARYEKGAVYVYEILP